MADQVDPSGSAIAIKTGEQREVPPGGQVGIEGRCLDKTSDPFRQRSGGRRLVASEETHGSGVTSNQSETDTDERGLPRAVRTKQTMQLAGRSTKAYAVEGLPVAVRLRHADDLEGGLVLHVGRAC